MTAKMTSRPPIKSKRVSWTFRNAIEKTVAANGSNASIRLAVVGKMSLRLRANIKNGATVPNRMMTSSKPNWNHVSVRWTRHIGCSAVRKTPAISSPQPVTVNAPYFGSSVRGIKVLVATPDCGEPAPKEHHWRDGQAIQVAVRHNQHGADKGHQHSKSFHATGKDVFK